MMARIEWNAPYGSTAATWTEWAKDLAAAFVTVGLVKTSDTGQTDIANMSDTLPSTNTDVGYEVYRLDDSLQATVPVFLRVAYGRDTSGYPRLTLGFWRATDGAGNISGNPYSGSTGESPTTMFTVQPSTSNTSMATNSYAAGDGSGFWVATSPLNSTQVNRCAFGLDRLRDASGAATDDGLLLFTSSGGVISYVSIWTARHTTSRGSYRGYLGNGMGELHPTHSVNSSLELNGAAPLLPLMWLVPEVRYSRMVAMSSVDVVAGATFDATEWFGVANVGMFGTGTNFGNPWSQSTIGSPSIVLYYDPEALP